MTNATVDTTVASVDGQVLTVKYKGGVHKIIIGKDALIVSNIPGSAGRSQARHGDHRTGGRGDGRRQRSKPRASISAAATSFRKPHARAFARRA